MSSCDTYGDRREIEERLPHNGARHWFSIECPECMRRRRSEPPEPLEDDCGHSGAAHAEALSGLREAMHRELARLPRDRGDDDFDTVVRGEAHMAVERVFDSGEGAAQSALTGTTVTDPPPDQVATLAAIRAAPVEEAGRRRDG